MRPPSCLACRGRLELPPARYSTRTYLDGQTVICPKCQVWTRIVPRDELPGWLRAGWLWERR